MNISEKNIKTLEDNLDLIFDRPPPAHRPPPARPPPAHRPPTAHRPQHSALSTQHSEPASNMVIGVSSS